MGRAFSKTSIIKNLEVDTVSFNRWFNEFQKISGVNVGVAIRKQGLDLIRDVMKSTPVDTGRARMGWSGLHRKLGKRVSPKGSDSKAQEEGKRLGTAKDMTKLRFGSNPYVEMTNNVNYILMLERGHSLQVSPGMMIARNLKRHAGRLKETVQDAIADAGKESQGG